ncbi:hypothetical protein AGMMS49545_19300 [Betaproteobacteria bacterium]|nr:hypothetical protein AGMMS49545_19300 [Betaproteobacteria bacterium]GHU48157.1 hypothetical protein AGMMS50289_24410 [Betaproteobacteria bacterium]
MNACCINLQSVAFIGASLYLISFQTQAAELSIPQCPEKITIQQNIVSPIEDDWKAADDNHSTENLYSLRGVNFSYLEYPSIQSGFLIPTEEEKQKNGDLKIFYDYLFSSNEPHDFWIACSYRNTSVVLVRKIPENVVRCEVNYPDIPGEVKTFRCFDTSRTK